MMDDKEVLTRTKWRIRRYVRCPEDAEEVINSILFEWHKTKKKDRSLRVLYNMIEKHKARLLSANRRLNELKSDTMELYMLPDKNKAVNEESRDLLHTLIDKLSKRQQQAVRSKYWFGQKNAYKELKCSPMAEYNLRNWGLRRLKQALAERGITKENWKEWYYVI